eukprot:6956540-Alexandrium_andersonii.AAC.1
MEELQDESECGDMKCIKVAMQDVLDGIGDQLAEDEGLEAELSVLRAVVNPSMPEAVQGELNWQGGQSAE